MSDSSMATWDIEGFDRDSGEPRTAVVNAGNERDAVRQVNFVVSAAKRRPAMKRPIVEDDPKKKLLAPCRVCGTEVSRTAKVCPRCGENKPVKAKPTSIKVMAGLVCVGLLLSCCCFGIIGKGRNARNTSDAPRVTPLPGGGKADLALARRYAFDLVQKRLKSPSTASFPSAFSGDTQVTHLGKGSYLVTSWVDSQNGFGATIRTRFFAEVKITSDAASLTRVVFDQ